MKLIELVSYFRAKGSFKIFCQNQSLDTESEVIEIFMERPFSLESDITFSEIENTKGDIEYVFNDGTYYYIFDFYYFMDVIEESNQQYKNLSNNEVSNILLSYAINDA